MAGGNLSKIIAGQAYVSYRVGDQEKFDKDNKRAEERFKGSHERMWKYYVQQRFKYEKWEKQHQANMEKFRTLAAERQRRDAERQRRREVQEARRLEVKARRQRQTDLYHVSLYGAIGGQYLRESGMAIGRTVMDSVRQYGTVEAYMLNIRESIRDNTNSIIEDMQRLEKESYRLGESTEYDAAHIASGFDVLAVQNAAPEQMLKVMGSIVNMASVFSNDRFGKIMPDQAATVVTEIMKAWKMGFEEIPSIVDKLALAGRKGNISIHDLGDAMRYASGMASETGETFDRLLAMMVYLDQRGQKGEMGGNAISGIMSTLLDPPKEARQFLESQGIQLPETGKLNMFDVISAFDKATAGMSPIERARVVATAFPNRQMRGFELLLGGGQDMMGLANEFANSQGKGAQLASAKREGVNFILDVFDSAMQTLKAEFGRSLKDEITTIFRALAEAIGFIAQTIHDHPWLGKALGALAAGLVLLGGAIGTLLTAWSIKSAWSLLIPSLTRLGFLPQLLNLITGAFSLLVAAATSVPAIIAAVVTAVAGLAAFLDYTFNDGRIFGPIYQAVKDLWAWIWGLESPRHYQNGLENLQENVVTAQERAILGNNPFASMKTRMLLGLGTTKAAAQAAGTGDLWRGVFGGNVLKGIATGAGNLRKNNPQGGFNKTVGGGVSSAAGGMGIPSSNSIWSMFSGKGLKHDWELSMKNPANAAALKQWQQQNPIIPGFEDRSLLNDQRAWQDFLFQFRSDKATRKHSTKNSAMDDVLNQVGAFDMRTQEGAQFVAKLMTPRDDMQKKLLDAANKQTDATKVVAQNTKSLKTPHQVIVVGGMG